MNHKGKLAQMKCLFGFLLLLLSMSGCSQTSDEQVVEELSALQSIYADFCSAEMRPPKDSDEFLAFAEGAVMTRRPGQELCRPAIESGEYVVLWGADYWGQMDDAVPRVLIYQAKTKSEGGWVAYTMAFKNSHIHFLTPAEFEQAPRVSNRN